MIVGLLVVCGANVFAFVGPTYAEVIIARTIAAAGSALWSPLALASIDDFVPVALRGRAQGIGFAGFGVALMLSLPIATLVANAFGWRSVIAIASALPLISALLASRLHVRPDATAALHVGPSAARTSSASPAARHWEASSSIRALSRTFSCWVPLC